MTQAIFNYSIWSVAGNILAVVDGIMPWNGLPFRVRHEISQYFCNSSQEEPADNVIYLWNRHSERGDFDVCIVEPDGTLASMCGNGIGCSAAHHAYLIGASTAKLVLRVHREQEDYRVHLVNILDRRSNFCRFRVQVGFHSESTVHFLRPQGHQISIAALSNEGLQLHDAIRSVCFSVVGEPHLVLLFKDRSSMPELLSLPIPPLHFFKRGGNLFPLGTNIIYCTVPVDAKGAFYRPFERNCKATSSCSTGAGAAYKCLCNHRLWNNEKPLAFVGPGEYKNRSSNFAQIASMDALSIYVETSATRLRDGDFSLSEKP